MKNTLPTLLLLIPTALLAQDQVLFDAHSSDHPVYTLINTGGGDLLTDNAGNILTPNPVYSMSVADRVQRGFSTRVTANGTNDRDAMGTPIFIPTYLDVTNSTGKGFNDPALGAPRRAAFEAVLSYLAGIIDNEGTIDLEIRESFFASPSSNPFAYSAPHVLGGKGFNMPLTTMHLTTGTDPSAANPDGYLQFNFSDALNYNLNGLATTSAAQYDFTTVALHEMMHVLGFTSFISETGESQAGISDVYTSFDGHLADLTKAPLLVATGTGSSTTVTKPAPSALINNQVWFDLGDGDFAPIYSPTVFNTSSIDHFDNGRNPGANYVMHPSMFRGQNFRTLSNHEVMVLEAIGYDVDHSMATAINEASEFAGVSGNLFPNPSQHQGEVQINIGKVNDAEILVVVYDMMGRQSYSKVIINQGAGPITAIDPYNNLAPGM